MVKIPPQTFQSDYSIRNNSAARLITFSLSPLGSMSAAHYDAAGRLTSDTLGNGETETWTYSKRGWPVSSTATLNSTNIYSYNITSFAPDGDILAASDSVNGNWTYSYDPFNRLVGSNQNSGQAVYSYVYDRFGNRWQQNGPNSMQLIFTGNNPSNPQNNNRMDGYTYDAAGNLLNDGTHQYFYDAENHLIQMDGSSGYCSTGSGTAATACYFYDAAGHRVLNTAVPDCVGLSGLAGGLGYIYDLSGRWVAGVATDANNDGPCAYEVYAGNRHLVHGSSPWTYIHSDWLGTERVRYCTGLSGCGGAGGTFQDNCTSLPFGDGLTCTNALNNKHFSHGHLTGKEHDPESGLDNFGARFNSSSFGRFMSPDVAFVDQHAENPQSWNLYTYVRNDPIVSFDPNGECTRDQNGNFTGDDCRQDTGTGNKPDVVTVNATPLLFSFRQFIGLDRGYNQIQWEREEEWHRYVKQMGAKEVRAELPIGPGDIESLGKLAEELLLSKNSLKHILKHLKDFQKLDPQITIKEVVQIGEDVVKTGTQVNSNTWVKTVLIAGKEVVVKAAVNANDMLRTVFPRY